MMAGSASAATVSYVGFQNEIEGEFDTPNEGWRNASPTKTYDIDGDNILGTDGFYIPGAVGGSADIQLPAYVASIAKDSSGGENWSAGFGLMDDPSNPSGTDTWNYGGWRDNTGSEIELTTITLSGDAATLLAGQTLRLGWLYDVYNFSGSHILRVAVDSGGDSGATPTLSYSDNGLDAAFFDISNVSNGDVIRMYGTSVTSAAVAGGVTFDTLVPEPSSLALLGLGGFCLFKRKRRG